MNVMNITRCPTSPEMFRNRGKELGCSVGKEYHCMMNEKKRHVELCISRSWIQPDHCPEYNTAANRIDVSPCDASDGVCPPAIYWSNNTFLYSGCLPEQGTTNTSDPEKDSNDILVISVVVSLVIICIACAVLFVVVYRRKRHRSKTEEECPLFTEENTLFPLEEEIKKGRETIDEHRADGTYVPTHAAKKGKVILDEKKILVIQGVTGSGKTKTALQIASEWMREDGSSRKCVYRKSLDDLQSATFHDNTCIILDGCFTRWVLDSSSTNVSKVCLRLHEQIKEHNLIYLIITVHKGIYSTHRSMLQKYDLFSNEHNLTLEYEDYEEKKKILTSHLTHSEDSTRHTLAEKELKKLLSKCTRNVGFPCVCWMYTNIPECEKEGDAFFRACEFVLQKIIANMKNPLKCCLYYAMLRNKFGEFDTNDINTNDIDKECLNELKKEYSCEKMTNEQLFECFGKDNPYFTSRGNHVSSISQTVIYEACLKVWVLNKKNFFLRFCNLEQVKENIRDKTYKVESRNCILAVKKGEFSLFAPRFATMMEGHKELGYHSLLQNELFCRILDEKRSENKNHSVVQKEIPAVHIEWETSLLLPGEKLTEQQEQQQEQQTKQQQQQSEQQQQKQEPQQKREKSLMQGENIEVDCPSATSNEKVLKLYEENDRQQDFNTTAAQEKKGISKTKKLQQPQRKPQKNHEITIQMTRNTDLHDETNKQPLGIKDDHFSSPEPKTQSELLS